MDHQHANERASCSIVVNHYSWAIQFTNLALPFNCVTKSKYHLHILEGTVPFKWFGSVMAAWVDATLQLI